MAYLRGNDPLTRRYYWRRIQCQDWEVPALDALFRDKFGRQGIPLPPELTRRHTTMSPAADGDIPGLLRELEHYLGLAEEIRARLALALADQLPAGRSGRTARTGRPSRTPRDTGRSGRTGRTTTAAPADDLADLAQTGRGVWAWAKEHDRVKEVQQIGRDLALGSRVVDWSPEEVARVITALRQDAGPPDLADDDDQDGHGDAYEPPY